MTAGESAVEPRRFGFAVRIIAVDSSALFLANLAFLVTGIVRVKLTALLFGAQTLGLVGQLSQAVAAVVTISALGLGTGMRLVLSRVTDRGRGDAIASAVIRITGFAALMLFVVGEILASDIAQLLLGSTRYAGMARIALLSVPLGILTQVLIPVAQAAGEFKEIAIAACLTAVVGALATGLLLATRHETAAVATIPLATAVQALSVLVLSRSARAGLAARASLASGAIRELVSVGSISFVLAVADGIGESAVRVRLVHSGGLHEVGLYQALYLHSAQVFGLLFGAVTTALMVHATHAIGTMPAEKLSQSMNDAAEKVVLVVAVVAFLSQIFAAVYVDVLFSNGLLAAADAVAAQTVSELLRSAAWTFGALLLPLNLRAAWAAAGFTAVLIRTVGVWLLAPVHGLFAVPMASAVAWAASLLIVAVGLRSRGLRVSRRAWLFMGWSTAVVSVGALHVDSRPWALSPWPALALLLWVTPVVALVLVSKRRGADREGGTGDGAYA